MKTAKRIKGSSYLDGTGRYQAAYDMLDAKLNVEVNATVSANVNAKSEVTDLMTIFRVIRDATIYACTKPGTSNRVLGKWWIANRNNYNYTFKSPIELMHVVGFLNQAYVPISLMEGVLHEVVKTVVKVVAWKDLYPGDLKYYNSNGDHQEDFATLYCDMAMNADFSKSPLANVLRTVFNVYMSHGSMSYVEFNVWWFNEGEDASLVHCTFANEAIRALADASDADDLEAAFDAVIVLATNVRSYARAPFMMQPSTKLEDALILLYNETPAYERAASCFAPVLKAMAKPGKAVKAVKTFKTFKTNVVV
jgi:hypothetical protein